MLRPIHILLIVSIVYLVSLSSFAHEKDFAKTSQEEGGSRREVNNDAKKKSPAVSEDPTQKISEITKQLTKDSKPPSTAELAAELVKQKLTDKDIRDNKDLLEAFKAAERLSKPGGLDELIKERQETIKAKTEKAGSLSEKEKAVQAALEEKMKKFPGFEEIVKNTGGNRLDTLKKLSFVDEVAAKKDKATPHDKKKALEYVHDMVGAAGKKGELIKTLDEIAAKNPDHPGLKEYRYALEVAQKSEWNEAQDKKVLSSGSKLLFDKKFDKSELGSEANHLTERGVVAKSAKEFQDNLTAAHKGDEKAQEWLQNKYPDAAHWMARQYSLSKDERYLTGMVHTTPKTAEKDTEFQIGSRDGTVKSTTNIGKAIVATAYPKKGTGNSDAQAKLQNDVELINKSSGEYVSYNRGGEKTKPDPAPNNSPTQTPAIVAEERPKPNSTTANPSVLPNTKPTSTASTATTASVDPTTSVKPNPTTNQPPKPEPAVGVEAERVRKADVEKREREVGDKIQEIQLNRAERDVSKTKKWETENAYQAKREEIKKAEKAVANAWLKSGPQRELDRVTREAAELKLDMTKHAQRYQQLVYRDQELTDEHAMMLRDLNDLRNKSR